MDFVITKEQIRVQKAAREFLKAKFDSDFVREMESDEKGYTPQTWKKMSELDWMALAIPEATTASAAICWTWFCFSKSLAGSVHRAPSSDGCSGRIRHRLLWE